MKRPVPLFSSPVRGGGGGYFLCSYDHSYTPYCDLHEPTNKLYL